VVRTLEVTPPFRGRSVSWSRASSRCWRCSW
jgi:hypothetical protein